MNHAFGTIGLAVAALASTNLDDLLLLATLFVDAEFSSHSIIVGQFIGMAVLVGLSAVAALLAVIIPDRWLALLGFLPSCWACTGSGSCGVSENRTRKQKISLGPISFTMNWEMWGTWWY